MKIIKRFKWFITGLCIGLFLGVGFTTFAASQQYSLFTKLGVLAEVLGAIENHYVEQPNAQTIVYGAAKGALHSLDSNSQFYSPLQYKHLLQQTDG